MSKNFSRLHRGVFLALLFLALTGCDQPAETSTVNLKFSRQDIEAVSKGRIFFGHQSVGRNLLQGLDDLAKQSDVQLRIASPEEAIRGAAPGVYQVDIGKNKDPLGKIAAFRKYVAAPAVPYDVATLKFCYEDLAQDAMREPQKLLDEYARAIADIRAAQPKLKIVHMTVPLRADPPGWKTAIKRLINRTTEEDADNQLRNQYNALLRKRFANEEVFDLAALESTHLDGKRSYFMAGGETVYTLAQEFTTDGGHLNKLGREDAAAIFASMLAGELKD